MIGIPVGELVGGGICLLIGSLVAGVESALTSLPEPRLRALHDELGKRRKAQLARYLADPTRVLTRLLAIRVLALIVASVLATNALAPDRGPWWHLALLTAVLSFAYGLLAEVFTVLGRSRGRVVAPVGLTLTQPLEWVISPLAVPLSWIGRAIQRAAQARSSAEPPPVTEREVEYLVEEAEQTGALDAKRGEMMQNVLELKDLTARDVMVPRTRMHAIEASTPMARAHAIMAEEGHSRVPVYRGQIDNIVGVLHAKDLFRATLGPMRRASVSTPPSGASERVSDRPPSGDESIDALVRKPAFFVAEAQSALEVLREMQSRQTHMAVVVDEFGAVIGLVTLEDILEELVGDIQDEHDVAESAIVDLGEGRFLAAAAISISELSEHLGVELPSSETYASLGGFLAHRAGRMPSVGTVVRSNGHVFTVKEGDARRATKVEIVRDRAAESDDASGTPLHAAE